MVNSEHDNIDAKALNFEVENSSPPASKFEEDFDDQYWKTFFEKNKLQFFLIFAACLVVVCLLFLCFRGLMMWKRRRDYELDLEEQKVPNHSHLKIKR